MRINPWQRHYHSDPASLARGEVTITRRGKRIIIACPYQEAFKLGARSIAGASWRGSIRVWSFPTAQRGAVRDLVARVFGGQWLPDWLVES